MNAEEIKKNIEAFKSAKPYFKGVFSINTLPTKLSTPSFLVCNFDTDVNPGSHWFCLFKNTKTKLDCFYSLGLNSEKLELIQKYCKIEFATKITFNETQVQSNLTSTCGNFVLYFAFQRLHNLDLQFDELLNEIFEENIDNNEVKVANFFLSITK